LTHGRDSRGTYSRYDGALARDAVRSALAQRFGSEYVFSATQFDTYLHCPFQFFARYVLGLKRTEDVSDLDEDYALGGTLIHRALESWERRAASGELSIDPLEIVTQMHVELATGSIADPGLTAVLHGRCARVLRSYADQAEAYRSDDELGARVRAELELQFGKDDGPWLVLGEGESTVKLSGKIDRIDVVERDAVRAFRVIDYKTGAVPSRSDVDQLRKVQLPLYALAVERLGLVEADGGLADAGYWSLKENGYKAVLDAKSWAGRVEALEARMLELVTNLRSGVFVVDPAEANCERTCEFGMVCRIGQVRHVEKSLADERNPA
jgi:ATP-dependent helicase/nuclease subunit B